MYLQFLPGLWSSLYCFIQNGQIVILFNVLNSTPSITLDKNHNLDEKTLRLTVIQNSIGI